MLEEVKIIKGDSFFDDRGELTFVNDVSIEGVKRFYFISNKTTKVIRAWQAHKVECKYFYALEGSFLIAVVKLDNFENPAPDLKAKAFKLHSTYPQLLIVPPGYANGIRAISDKNNLLVLSTLGLEESKKDTWRFPAHLWFDWDINTNVE